MEFIVKTNFPSFTKALRSVDLAQTFEKYMRPLGEVMARELESRTPVGATGYLQVSTMAHLQIIRQLDAVDAILKIKQPAIRFPVAGASTPPGFYRHYISGPSGSRTRPHMPPYQALIPWVMKKLGVLAVNAARQAYGLALHIKRRGTAKNPYTGETVVAMLPEISKTADAMGTDIRVQVTDFDRLPLG